MRLFELQQTVSKPQAIDNIISVILRDCQPYLQLIGGLTDPSRYLLRGMVEIPSKDQWHKYTQPYTTHPDRKFRDTNARVGQLADDWFLKTIGWRARTNNALFCAGFASATHDYGETCAIFPIGNIEYLWSEKVLDLTFDLHQLVYFGDEGTPDKLKPQQDTESLAKKVNALLSKGAWHFNEGFDLYWKKHRRKEMIIRCQKYYAIPLERNMDNISFDEVLMRASQ